MPGFHCIFGMSRSLQVENFSSGLRISDLKLGVTSRTGFNTLGLRIQSVGLEFRLSDGFRFFLPWKGLSAFAWPDMESGQYMLVRITAA